LSTQENEAGFTVLPIMISQFTTPVQAEVSVEHDPVSAWWSNRILQFRTGIKRNFWPLRNFWPIIVCQLFGFSE